MAPADPVDLRPHLGHRICRRGRQPDAGEHRQIDDVVAHVRHLGVGHALAGDDALVAFDLVEHALLHDPDAQLRRPVRGGGRRSRREEADRQPRALRPDHGDAVADAEVLALGAVRVHRHAPVREHTVHVEQQELDPGGFRFNRHRSRVLRSTFYVRVRRSTFDVRRRVDCSFDVCIPERPNSSTREHVES